MGQKQKVHFFIDGYNLFYGIKSFGKQHYKWLNIQKLAESLINPSTEEVVKIHYFTTKVISSPKSSEMPENILEWRQRSFVKKASNQEKYLSALQTLDKVTIHYGQYKHKIFHCPLCQRSYEQPIEKITDVNISVQALLGAHNNEYDIAYFITGDTDLASPMKALKGPAFGKCVKIAFPPNRSNDNLKKNFPNNYREIKQKGIIKCLFPLVVETNTGYKIECPEQWQIR